MDISVLMKTVVMLLTVMMQSSLGIQLCDQCNCPVSTSDADSKKVYNMGLNCNTGTVTWYGAFGGILLQLSPFIHGDFRACFLVESDKHTTVKISQEGSHLARRSNYRLKLEEVRRPELQHISRSKGKGQEFCVYSNRREPLVLFVEAVKEPEVGSVSKVLIHYDMEKTETNSKNQVVSSSDECRPCSKDEILDAYCSMDFVVVGSMADVTDNLLTDHTDIQLEVKQIIHTVHPERFQRVKRSDPNLTARVVVPKKCRIRKGEGDFLFTGRMRLNQLSLKCAPYLDDWRHIQNEAECTHS